MAEAFNNYFTSVFTVEDTSNIPAATTIFHGNEEDKLRDIHIDESVIRKKLYRSTPQR